MVQDYYSILGVEKSASEKELKTAFRKKAMQYHPDKNPDNKEAEDKFKELNKAYEVLKDPQKRAQYDRFGESAFEGGAGGAGGGFGGFGGFDGFSSGGGGFSNIFEDIFADFGGFGNQGVKKQRGSDLKYQLNISLKEAFTGIDKQLKIKVDVQCEDCNGTGAKDPSDVKTCDMCHGTGKISSQSGFTIFQRACNKCHGTGKIIKHKCKSCHGAGIKQDTKVIDISIPSGIQSGSEIRLSGKGDSSKDGINGDLYILINIEKSDYFKREGEDLYLNAEISVTDAILGTSIEIPTIDGGYIKVPVQAGIQSGELIRLKNKGMKGYRSILRGCMYIKIIIKIPKRINSKQKKLLKEFAEAGK